MIKLMKSTFHEEAKTKAALVDFISKAEMLSMGAETKKFEEAFAKKQGRAHAVFVNSGSSANLVLIQALLNLGRLKRGDRVGFSALTWSTNVMPLIQLGLVPVAIDCEIDTLNISPKTLEPHLGSIDALFLTNVLGFADDLPAVRTACEKEGVLLLEDNCEALGSSIEGMLLGNFSAASSFSFFVGHHLSTVEGGMIATDDMELYEMMLMARAHGWSRNLSKETDEKLRAEYGIDNFYARYTFYDLGYNVRPTDIQSCIGTLQLPYWDEIVRARERNYHTFAEAVSRNAKLLPFRTDHMDVVSNFAMPLVFKEKTQCEAAKKRFVESDVEIRPVIAGDMTRQPFYKKYVPEASAACDSARFIHENGFYFGNNQELTEEELATLTRLITEV